MSSHNKYSTQKGYSDIDWWEILNYNPAELSMENRGFISSLSFDWVTCACGTQCSIIPRLSDGAPEDLRLRLLGRDFYIAVLKFDFDKAKTILKSIEERSAFLINEITSKTPEIKDITKVNKPLRKKLKSKKKTDHWIDKEKCVFNLGVSLKLLGQGRHPYHEEAKEIIGEKIKELTQ